MMLIYVYGMQGISKGIPTPSMPLSTSGIMSEVRFDIDFMDSINFFTFYILLIYKILIFIFVRCRMFLEILQACNLLVQKIISCPPHLDQKIITFPLHQLGMFLEFQQN